MSAGAHSRARHRPRTARRSHDRRLRLRVGRASVRVLEHEPAASGIGIDRDPAAIARARTNADARDLRDRVRLECTDVAGWSDEVDIAVVIGASHAWGGTKAALDAIWPLLRPGGRLLFGEGIWQQPPTPSALAALDAHADDYTSLAGLVDACLDKGYRLLALSTATLDEWDALNRATAPGRNAGSCNTLRTPPPPSCAPRSTHTATAGSTDTEESWASPTSPSWPRLDYSVLERVPDPSTPDTHNFDSPELGARRLQSPFDTSGLRMLNDQQSDRQPSATDLHALVTHMTRMLAE